MSVAKIISHMNFHIVVAVDIRNGISKDGKIPWRIPADIRRFRDLTTKTSDPSKQNAVIMGRKTMDSLPMGFLPGRKNIVISRRLSKRLKQTQEISVARSLDDALEIAGADRNNVESAFHIGGARSYADAITHPDCAGIYLTRVYSDFECDLFFPAIPPYYKIKSQSEVMKDAGLNFMYINYIRS